MGTRFKTTRSAAYKLHVYFRGGETATFFSRDWKNSAYRPEMGLQGLLDYIESKAATIKYALIYDKRGGRDVVIGKYQGESAKWILKPNHINTLLP